jgi:hypothetical protein
MVRGIHASSAGPITSAQPAPSSHASGLLPGLFFTGVGIALLIRPELNMRMIQQNFPDRDLSPDKFKYASLGGRILGAGFVLFGLCILYDLGIGR